MKQRIRYFCLTLLVMVAGMANAQNVAKVGDTECSTLQAAFDAAEDGATIQLKIPNAEIAGIFQDSVASFFRDTLDQSRQKALMDALYVKNASLLLDLRLIGETVRCVLLREGNAAENY